MPFVLTTDPEEFADRAQDFLTASINRNVMATVLATILGGGYDTAPLAFAYRLDAAGAVTAAAMRSPPYNMMCAQIGPEDAPGLLEAWLALDPALPGVNGEPDSARALAAAWTQRGGGEVRLRHAMAMHATAEIVDPPRPPAGRLRPATVAERALLIDWWEAFVEEAEGVGAERAAASVDAKLAAGIVFVWDDGEPVCLVAIAGEVAGTARIGPVYTPPRWRRRGYAGMAVAEVSRAALARGAETCMLFTDLANPTANKIYAEVGYRRFADWEEYDFARA